MALSAYDYFLVWVWSGQILYTLHGLRIVVPPSTLVGRQFMVVLYGPCVWVAMLVVAMIRAGLRDE